ncbi:MAG: ABC transporter transmembrane domain-containing protein [Roseburia sp.]|nr:ABC transporter transmembrane domain-containing protein [Roseburia sp.]
MIKFYRFAWKRFNRKAKMCFLLNFFTSFVNNCSMVLIPILQKEMIERMTNSQLKISYICIYFLCGVAGVLAVIAESVLLSHLERTLQRALQEELIESALKNKNPIIESKGPGAYMVSVFGDSEHISNLLETNIVNIFFQCISTIVILVITAQWSKAFVGTVMVSYLVMIVLHFVSDKAFIKKFQAAREKIYEANPRVLECIENRLSVMGFADINRYMKEIYQIFDERDGFMKQANTINSASVSALGGIRILALSIFFIVSVCQMNAGKMEIASFIAMLSYF